MIDKPCSFLFMFEPLAEETIDFYDAVKEYNVMLKESISVTYKTLLPM